MHFSVFNSLLIESKLILLLFLSGIISNLEFSGSTGLFS